MNRFNLGRYAVNGGGLWDGKVLFDRRHRPRTHPPDIRIIGALGRRRV